MDQKRTFSRVWAMSALPPKADIGTQPCDCPLCPIFGRTASRQMHPIRAAKGFYVEFDIGIIVEPSGRTLVWLVEAQAYDARCSLKALPACLPVLWREQLSW